MNRLTRRRFLQAAAAVPVASRLARYHVMAASEKGKVKIRDLRAMVFQGPDRNYTLVRIDTDAGIWGFGEAYGSPGVGVREQVLALRPNLIDAARVVQPETIVLSENLVRPGSHCEAESSLRRHRRGKMVMWSGASLKAA